MEFTMFFQAFSQAFSCLCLSVATVYEAAHQILLKLYI